MVDRDEYLLHGEFAAFRAGLMAEVQPVGPAAVRATVRRRRRIAVAAAAVVAITLIVGPVAGYAALNRDGTTPAPADSIEPSLPPTPTLTPSNTSTATPAAPDGRIDRAELLAARLDLPAWSAGSSCPVSGVQLIESGGGVGDTRLETGSTRGLRYGDVDGDGAAETIAMVECLAGNVVPSPQQVVAFDRDAAGRIVTLGRVADSSNKRPAWFRQLDVRPDGSVRVEVWLNPPSDGTTPAPSNRQWRTYRWDGAGFVQTGGPTSFQTGGPTSIPASSAPPASLAITATDLVYGAPDGTGNRYGSMTVTITNTGAGTVTHPMVTIPRSAGNEADHTKWRDCQPLIARPDAFRCLGEPLAPGAKRTLTFAFFTSQDAAPADATVRVDSADAEGSALPGGGAQTTYLIKRGS